MKKTNISFGPLTRKQRRTIKNLLLCQLRNAGTEAEFIVLFAAFSRTVKGNLGIDIRTADGNFIIKSNGIHAALLANTGGYYSPVFDGLTDLGIAIENLETAVKNAKLRMLGSGSAKIIAKQEVMKWLKKALIYINGLSIDDEENSEEIITGANMFVNKAKTIDKQDFSVKQGRGAGEILLYQKAIKIGKKYVNATYEWQISLDGGNTWKDLPYTKKAKTKVTGMTRGLKTWFRKRSISQKTGISKWSMPVSIVPVK